MVPHRTLHLESSGILGDFYSSPQIPRQKTWALFGEDDEKYVNCWFRWLWHGQTTKQEMHGDVPIDCEINNSDRPCLTTETIDDLKQDLVVPRCRRKMKTKMMKIAKNAVTASSSCGNRSHPYKSALAVDLTSSWKPPATLPLSKFSPTKQFSSYNMME